MRICVMLKCTAEDGKKDAARVISRWDSWPCKPAVGETYWLWGNSVDTELDGSFIVQKVSHMRVHRSLWERMCGKPAAVIIVTFETDDPRILGSLRHDDLRWKVRQKF